MSRFREAFEACRREGRAALMPYITAGDPSLEWTKRLALELIGAGADMLELGVPYSDPLADGPTVQAAGQRALQAGTTLAGVFSLVRELRRSTQVPIALLVYYNCIFRWTEARFVESARESGVDALVVPDLPPEEAESLDGLCADAGIDVAYLLAPTSTEKRMEIVVNKARGFIYCVSLTGVTGARRELSAQLAPFIERLRATLRRQKKDLPLVVGFGISTPEHVEQASRLADGVIVGSALIDRMHAATDPAKGVEACTSLVRAMRGVLDAGMRAGTR